MPDTLLETLPLPQRLALSYATGTARDAALVLFALDMKLAQAIRQQREPALAQIRVAWWRDLLAQAPGSRPPGDPLIDGLAIWHSEQGALIELVDGWEHLIADGCLQPDAIAAFAHGRGFAFVGLLRLLGVRGSEDHVALAGRRWALADLATGLSNPAEREEALDQVRALGTARMAVPRELRPLAVLDGLACTMIVRGGDALLSGPISLLQALRIGLIGR